MTNTAFLRPLEASGVEAGGKGTPVSWHIHADYTPGSTCITSEVSLPPCGPGSQLGAVAALPVTWLLGMLELHTQVTGLFPLARDQLDATVGSFLSYRAHQESACVWTALVCLVLASGVEKAQRMSSRCGVHSKLPVSAGASDWALISCGFAG